MFSLIHLACKFEGQLTTNFLMSQILFLASLQIILKTLWMWYNRDNLLKLLDKTKSLYTDCENEEICVIAEINLKKLSNFWIVCFKIASASVYITCVLLAICNALKGEDGILITIPFIPINFRGYLEFRLLIQTTLIGFGCVSVIYIDLMIVFFGIEIMAASNILFDYISLHKDAIQEYPDDLKIITERFCKLVDNIKLFNSVISFSSFLQFITSAFLSFSAFFIIRLCPENPIGYFTCFCIVIQLFLPCFFGEFIKIRLERLSTTLYLTNWYDLKLKDQKSFLIILGMIQKEYGLKAAGLYDINIYTFIQIMKMAVSWCAFIFTLHTYS
uniref:Uncharacterized protein n=1 Tax=Phlebotomus papatasi TaxID=29031 RepID=A0A3F2ZEL6_PHLPP